MKEDSNNKTIASIAKNAINEASEKAMWLCFIIEFVASAGIYIAIKALCGIAYAELFMLIAYALALLSSVQHTSKMIRDELKDRMCGKYDKEETNKEDNHEDQEED